MQVLLLIQKQLQSIGEYDVGVIQPAVLLVKVVVVFLMLVQAFFIVFICATVLFMLRHLVHYIEPKIMRLRFYNSKSFWKAKLMKTYAENPRLSCLGLSVLTSPFCSSCEMLIYQIICFLRRHRLVCGVFQCPRRCLSAKTCFRVWLNYG